jgi:hypothetical protein
MELTSAEAPSARAAVAKTIEKRIVMVESCEVMELWVGIVEMESVGRRKVMGGRESRTLLEYGCPG